MKRGWLFAAGTLLATFAFFAYESFQLSLSDSLGPGPGFFPFWLAVLGILLTAGLLAQLYLDRVDLGPVILEFDRAGMRSVALVLTGLIVATALLEVIGFRLAMLLLVAFVLAVLGVRRWVVIAICAVVGSFGVFHVFFDLLKVALPVGVFGF